MNMKPLTGLIIVDACRIFVGFYIVLQNARYDLEGCFP